MFELLHNIGLKMSTEEQAVEYIKNNNGRVYKKDFIEDFDPIGEKLLRQIIESGKVLTSTSGKTTIIFLS